MAKYVKKPIVVDAEQWFPGKEIDGVEYENDQAIIRTLEGPHLVSPGDWIITGIAGEKYPCKPDIFEKTYDIVKEQNIIVTQTFTDDKSKEIGISLANKLKEHHAF